MAFLTSLKYMTVLGTNHAVLSTAVDASPSGYEHMWTPSWVSIPGQDDTMLDDDDATSLCKATSTLADPILEIQFGTAQAITAFGISNHNLYTAGVREVWLEYHNGSTWVGLEAFGYGLNGDRDFALVFDSQSRTRFRCRFTAANGGALTPTAFYLGYVYWGAYYQFNRNPVQFVQTRRPAVRYLQSAGGMTHAVKTMRYRPATLEMNFVRANGTDVNILQLTHITDSIVAIIPPEVAPQPSSGPRGNEVFYGRLEEISVDPQTPSNISVLEYYNMQVLMRGAV